MSVSLEILLRGCLGKYIIIIKRKVAYAESLDKAFSFIGHLVHFLHFLLSNSYSDMFVTGNCQIQIFFFFFFASWKYVALLHLPARLYQHADYKKGIEINNFLNPQTGNCHKQCRPQVQNAASDQGLH